MRTRRSFTPEFKREAASLVLDQQSTIREACESMGVGATGMRNWVKQLQNERKGMAESRNHEVADLFSSAIS